MAINNNGSINNSNIGLTLLNSMGASQFDVANMAKVLANADVAAQRINLDRQKQRLDFQVSGFDLINRALQGFTSQIGNLLNPDTFQQRTASSSDSRVVTAQVSGQPASGSYQVEVRQLAQAHTLATSGIFANMTDVVGTGTLTITVGGVQHSFTIDATNNTLEGIRAAVNSAHIGVTASVINTGNGYKLMFSSDKTGAANAINISVVDGDGNNTDNAGLSQLINANMVQTVAAQDATIVINGLAINRSSNVISDVISGLTLNLNAADPGVTKTIIVTRDTTTAEKAVQNFVDLYNGLQDIFNQVGSYQNKPTTSNPASGSLKGDATLRMIRQQVQDMLAQKVSGLNGSVQSLADVGIATQRDGKLTLDTARLQQALSADPGAVARLFGASMSATDPQITYVNSTSQTPEGTWNLFVSTAARQASLTGAVLGGTGSITLTSTNNTLQISVNGTASSTLTLAPGTYTKAQLATLLQEAINADTSIAAAGGRVSVQYDSVNDRFVLTTDQFGSQASITMTGGTLVTSGVLGFATGASATGIDVGGQLSDPVTGHTYTFTGQGRHVRVSDFALSGLPKGLEFDIGGTATGNRGTISFSRGVAARFVEKFNQWTAIDGIVGQKLDNLHKSQQNVLDQQKKLDTRYQQLELRYRIQFGQLQAVLNSFKQTQASLAAQLAALQPQQTKY